MNLEEGLTFVSWEQAKLFFDNFALQEGFSYRIRRSESEDGEMVPQFQKLTSSMLNDIKKYVVKGRMDSASIYPLLINDYPQNTINKRDLYNAVYNIRQQNNPGRKCGKCRQFGHYANTCMD
ncbi:17489_t:CDS:2 [Entrophospora sp. SA101]|nr:17489_t:CDS:2 [Entrophospora sp. SA101]